MLEKKSGKKITSSIVAKNLSRAEIAEIQRERDELLGLTPVPGFELVTRQTYLELKKKRHSAEQVGLESSLCKAKSAVRKSDVSQYHIKPMYYAIPIPGYKGRTIQPAPELNIKSEVPESDEAKLLDITYFKFDIPEILEDSSSIESFVLALEIDVEPSLEALKFGLNSFVKKLFSTLTLQNHESVSKKLFTAQAKISFANLEMKAADFVK